MENPFRIDGPVTGDSFLDRTEEVRRITRALIEPRARLLVHAPRRMGKSSAVEEAIRRVQSEGRAAFAADLSGASTVADMATRVLQAAVRALSWLWPGVVGDLVNQIQSGISLTPDPMTGQPTLMVELNRRTGAVERQRVLLAGVLDAVDRLAQSKGRTIGIVLDNFQRVYGFGGEEAEWHLRAVIQRQNRIAYVLAGSGEELRAAATQKNRAFHHLFELLPLGAIDDGRFAAWIRSRMELYRVEADAAAARIVELAGPRTGDVVRLARAAFEIGAETGELTGADADRALDRITVEESGFLRAEWQRLTPLQQNVLRAIAAGEDQLFSRETRKKFALRDTGSVASAVDLLMQKELVVKTGTRYVFDSPFLRRWVARTALPDVGILPGRSA